MKTVRRALMAGVAGLAIVLGSPAQDKLEEVAQGFRAYIVAEPRFPADDVRNRNGKMQDVVTDHGLNPVVAVFARQIPADAANPLSELVKTQDALAEEYKTSRLGTFVVFLALKDEFRKDESRDARIKEITQWVSGVMPKRTTIGLAEATEVPDNQPLVPAQVTAMGIAAEDDIVIVFYDQYRVIKRWKFKASGPPGEADLADVAKTVTKRLAKKK
ncbi:MAG TPA: hypothetical protein VKE40_28560 [Gemmataceae bacterium]|nr:hypothetical protein [Gemmataceae bacterium]